MPSSLMLRRVALEKLSPSFIRMTRIGELGTTLAVTSNRRALQRNTEDAILHSHCRENLKSYVGLYYLSMYNLASDNICRIAHKL
jgi:hypothetical protein